MPKKYIDVDGLVAEWFEVSREEQPVAFEAWRRFRWDALKASFVPKSYTVPSVLPPSTKREAEEYAGIVKQIRESIGWKSDKAKIDNERIGRAYV